jgi:formate-dependent phosphoribosylglycinamide formyltransferase (GAR transformylase)
MNILLLCNHSIASYPYHEILKEYNFTLFLMTDKEIFEKDRKYIEKNSHKYKQIRYYDNFSSNGIVELDAIKDHTIFEFDAIVTVSETEIERAAKLREYLNISGQNFESAIAYRDKVKMKKYAEHGGVRTPKFTAIDSAVDLIYFISKNGYPVFVKPKSSAGSIGAEKINDEKDLKNFLSGNFVITDPNDPYRGYDKRYEVENYIADEFYSINGLVHENEIILLHVARYNTHADLEHISQEGYWSSEVIAKDNILYNISKEYIKKLISSLPVTDNFVFHSEVFIDSDNNITLCEIACRPPGGGMINAIDKIFGVDFFKLALLAQIDSNLIDKEKIIAANEYELLYASVFVHPSTGLLTALEEKCNLDFVDSYHPYVQKGKKYSGIGDNSCAGAALFVVHGKNEIELKENVQHTVSWFKNTTKWEV